MKGACVALALLAVTPAAALDLAEIQQRGVLRVIVAADEAPETFAIGAAAEPGFEREILEGFTRLQKLKIEVVRASSHAQRLPMLQKGEGDLIVAIFDTPERRQLVDFTPEVMPTHNIAVSLKPRPRVASIDELKALKVAVIRGAKPAEETVQAGVPASALVPVDTMEALVKALQKGDAGAAVLPVSEFALALKRSPGLQAGVGVGAPGRVAWAVRKEDDALEAALSQYLANFRRGSSWSRLVVKYFGDQVLTVLGKTGQ
jgi:polar amino acid transport system substrate-binding protein